MSSRGSVYYRLHARQAKFDRVVALSTEGISISAIARLEQLSWNTVARWLERAAAAAGRFHDRRVRGFDLYLELGSLQALAAELKARGWSNKRWTNKRGGESGGNPFNKNNLSRLFTNPLYIGRLRCGDEVVDGEHGGVVEQGRWDAVQARLDANAREPNRTRNKHEALLKGIARCGKCGGVLTYLTTRKAGRLYAYYVCQTVQKEGADACPGSRVAVRHLEAAVVEEIQRLASTEDFADQVMASATGEARREIERFSEEEAEAAAASRRLQAQRENLLDALQDANGAAGAITHRPAELDAAIQKAKRRAEGAGHDLDQAHCVTVDEAELRAALTDWDAVWSALFPAEQCRLIRLIVREVRFDATANEVAIEFHSSEPSAACPTP